MSLEAIKHSYALRQEREWQPPPGRYLSSGWVSTGSESELDPGLHGLALSRTPAWQFRAEKQVVLASKPVIICLTRGEELFFAENETLGIVATGETVFEAVEEFGEQLVDSYFHYKHLPWERTTGEATKLKQFYEEFFSEVQVEGRPPGN